MSRFRRFLWCTIAVVGVCVALAGVLYGPRLWRVYQFVRLYEEDRIAWNFLHMSDVVPATDLRASADPLPLPEAAGPLPATFQFGGEPRSLQGYLDYSRTTGLLVLHNGRIVEERYALGHSRDGVHISWSVAKSFVSALVGIALEEGRFDSIEDPVTRYLPELAGSGYDAVRIKDVLEMSSGVGFNEDYGDFWSDINRFGRVVAWGGSMAEFAATLRRTRRPGTYHHYVSIDTQVLGMLIARVTGVSLTEYMQSRIWDRVGMEHDARWLVDATGMELALGGLNVSLRDYARFGELYRNGGILRGRRIVPAAWVAESTTPDGPHLMPGKDNPASSSSWGYGYQWWIPDPDMGDYTAAGIYNQYIYVHPGAGVVIAKNSANHRYTAERQESKDLHIAMFRAIAASLGSAAPAVSESAGASEGTAPLPARRPGVGGLPRS
jgi:CubicO group peptidase (beta-lactamase class C family)